MSLLLLVHGASGPWVFDDWSESFPRSRHGDLVLNSGVRGRIKEWRDRF